jgi:hypothetical protein
MKAHGESDCNVAKSFTAGTGHVAHSVNDNEEVTRSQASRFLVEGDAGHSDGHQQKRPPKRAHM